VNYDGANLVLRTWDAPAKAFRETVRVVAVSGRGGGAPDWEKDGGPIPDGEYFMSPQIRRPAVTKEETEDTCAAAGIDHGYQPIEFAPAQPCWGRHRIKLKPAAGAGPTKDAIEVQTPEGKLVRRDGFFIHGGGVQTQGCVKIVDDAHEETFFTGLLGACTRRAPLTGGKAKPGERGRP
jgi:hypothetical protein